MLYETHKHKDVILQVKMKTCVTTLVMKVCGALVVHGDQQSILSVAH